MQISSHNNVVRVVSKAQGKTWFRSRVATYLLDKNELTSDSMQAKTAIVRTTEIMGLKVTSLRRCLSRLHCLKAPSPDVG